ncbi:hypothetical protein ABIF65_003882 [Bradyrhizobium japonicum]|uniref:hypothetical protein n=1 Tax=Bradyrhizobium TaxID=374 RepID=UPI0004895E55|nr:MULTISPECIES: hypothetical protein [Bradyrhizobium]MBR0884785.1 hypothetical protein [Bradyrhizobium liaoningense]MBR1005107.1 hypothetical protein [Bradyrhizobium liaoningense]MBR1071350.1 hypothetical protein [Bradyrhizobium liaoningense]MCP1741735.1 hypothetical protein [Bradyrhizobium japonicum]MCP1779440.1 hypothetical protein [Bradyrhizobium japonicum]
MITAPKRLWRPVLTVLDEAQFYAPEKGGPESLKSIISFMMLGRKRGFTGVLATPRPADLSKRAMNPVNNWLIGRCGQPADRKSASDAIGFSPNSPEARGLRSLETRHFWAFGPALYLEPQQIRVGSTETTIVKAGQATLPTPPAPAAMKRLLDQLNTAAKPADAKDSEDPKVLRAEIARLTAELAKPTRSTIFQTEPDAAAIAATEQRGYARGFDAGFSEAEGQGFVLWEASRAFAIEHAENIAQQLRQGRFQIVRNPAMAVAPSAPPAPTRTPQALPQRALAPAASGDGPLGGVQQKILNSVAEMQALFRKAPPRSIVAMSANYKNVKSTGFAKALSALSTDGHVFYPDSGTVALTESGVKLARPRPNAVTTADMQARVVDILGETAGRILQNLIDVYPQAVDREQLAERSGYQNVKSTGFAKAVSRLSSLGFVTYPSSKLARAGDVIFP